MTPACNKAVNHAEKVWNPSSSSHLIRPYWVWECNSFYFDHWLWVGVIGPCTPWWKKEGKYNNKTKLNKQTKKQKTNKKYTKIQNKQTIKQKQNAYFKCLKYTK